MQVQDSKFSFSFACRINVWILAFVWIIGFVVGAILSHFSEAYIVSLMRAAASCRVSIVWLVICNLFPLLLSAFAVYFSTPVVAECFMLFRAFSYGYIVFGLVPAFGLGGWLVGMLLLFSACSINVMLLWLFLSSDKMCFRVFWTRLAVCVSAVLVITVVDYLYIAPFLARIMEQF